MNPRQKYSKRARESLGNPIVQALVLYVTQRQEASTATEPSGRIKPEDRPPNAQIVGVAGPPTEIPGLPALILKRPIPSELFHVAEMLGRKQDVCQREGSGKTHRHPETLSFLARPHLRAPPIFRSPSSHHKSCCVVYFATFRIFPVSTLNKIRITPYARQARQRGPPHPRQISRCQRNQADSRNQTTEGHASQALGYRGNRERTPVCTALPEGPGNFRPGANLKPAGVSGTRTTQWGGRKPADNNNKVK